jgi:hypothetical protein
MKRSNNVPNNKISQKRQELKIHCSRISITNVQKNKKNLGK